MPLHLQIYDLFTCSILISWKTKERETPREKEEETGKVAIYFSEIAAYYRTCCEVQITDKK